ncbi:hypothetical protein GN958_ATG14751 [Phytophthora infestans]|uniref:Uncharacterized protein n=1 Tax=Phytophthora infestans TaxID=4787 RepID=A0A8S9U4L1_PHYIN|nr:hypothetical protein GN958_ATG16265 [Phytophthora infestans]KAF4136005.1 hypothetical protein GN958_ATG14751 [Phytophthora infestans]
MSWSNRATANGQSTNLSCSDDKQNDSQEQLMDSIETEHAYMIHEAVPQHPMRVQQHLPQPTQTGTPSSAHPSREGSAAAVLPPAGSTVTQQIAAEPQHSAWPPERSKLYGVDDIAKIPACIRSAVLEFRPTPTCTPLPLPRNHRSITFKYGARVNYFFRGTPVVGWLCMASDACRRKCTFL